MFRKTRKRTLTNIAGRPEQYVDRDRLIAVTLGEHDIRETMVKQRIFIGKNSDMAGEEEQSFKVLVQQAEYELHRGCYDRALGYLNKAVKVRNVKLVRFPDLIV